MHLAVAPRRELTCSSMCRVCHTRLFNALDQFGRRKLVTTTYAYDNNGYPTPTALATALMQNPAFIKEFAEAKSELRRALGL